MALLDAEFVRELELLKRRLETEARSRGSGQRAAPRQGSAAQFSQHRRYAPGDDLRRIDWLAFARSGQPMFKQHSAEEDTIGRILLDHSASLEFGSPSKLDAAKRIAGALSYLWLSGGLRCQLIGAQTGQAGERSRTAGAARFYAARRGRAVLGEVLREIEAVNAAGPTHLARWITQVVALSLRPGVLVVVSDFLDSASTLSALDGARAKGHDIILVHVLAQEELAPQLSGDLELADSETGQTLMVSVDADVIEVYQRRLSALCDGLELWAKKRGQTYLRVMSAEELAPVMLELVLGARRQGRNR